MNFWKYVGEDGTDTVLTPSANIIVNCPGTLLLEHVFVECGKRSEWLAKLVPRSGKLLISQVPTGWSELQLAAMGTQVYGSTGAIHQNKTTPDYPDRVSWNCTDESFRRLLFNNCERLVLTPALNCAVVSGALGTFDKDTKTCTLPLGAVHATRLESVSFVTC